MTHNTNHHDFDPRRSAAMIALLYALVGGIWIILSDRALLWIWPGASADWVARISTFKGWFYVAVTSLLLYALVFNRLRSLQRSQSALSESEMRYRRLVETVREGIWTLDPVGHTTFVNEEMARMLGYSPAELFGRPAADLVDPEYHQAWRELLYAPADDRRPYAPDILFRRKDGSELWGIVSVAPGDASLMATWLLLVTDVTSRRRVEEQLRRAQRLEAVGRLAGGVAHDFNNLLAIIVGYADSLTRHLPEGSDALKQVSEIQKASDRGADLIRRLLTFSRTQNTEMQLFDLGRSLSEMYPMLRRLISTSVQMSLEAPPAPLPVRAGAGQLEQVLMNLVVNAAEAMPRGGSMRISAARDTIPSGRAAALSLRAGVYAVLDVTDNGAGMDEQTRLQAFEPFFSTKQDKGTGLGLSVVYGIAQECGGQIVIESVVGKGTSVHVWLPLADPPAPGG